MIQYRIESDEGKQFFFGVFKVGFFIFPTFMLLVFCFFFVFWFHTLPITFAKVASFVKMRAEVFLQPLITMPPLHLCAQNVSKEHALKQLRQKKVQKDC
jgi:hypothetical protein